MLRELFTYAIATCPAFARRMGYLYEAIALQSRYDRHRAAWQGHIERTRQFLLSEASACPALEKALVLGSGILADVPLGELSSLFGEVLLVDVVFLPSVRRQVKPFGNVGLIEADVTGVSARLLARQPAGVELPPPSPLLGELAQGASWVVSLNLMSQLPVIPERYVLKRMPRITGRQMDEWCRELVSSHYRELCSLPAAVCMVSDFAYSTIDRHGAVLETGSTLRGAELPVPMEQWEWDIGPLGEVSRGYSRRLSVGAWHIR